MAHLPLLVFRDTTRFLFFTGKGGVGKTALSCAVSIALADSGKKTLLISTDPASNLDEMLGLELDRTPRPVPGVPGDRSRIFRQNVFTISHFRPHQWCKAIASNR